jgi:hypothetical protein
MVSFLRKYQTEEGELPYSVLGITKQEKPHFLCQQYNAFQLMNLLDYYQITHDWAIWPVLTKLTGFVASGITATGAARYDCLHEKPEVPYYTAALGAALSQAAAAGLGNYRPLADKAFRRVLSQQSPNGSFFYSRGNYRYLTDRRRYPRYLAMILCHLLQEVKSQQAMIGAEIQTPAVVG